MSQTVVLCRFSDSECGPFSERTAVGIQKQILNQLNHKQRDFLKQYTWRTDFCWKKCCTELTIRKSSFSSQEWTLMLFVFPDAELKTDSKGA